MLYVGESIPVLIPLFMINGSVAFKTCKTMYQTVQDSTDLQYIIELGAQRLVPVHPRPPNVSAAECLRILRDKANMWNSFKLNGTSSLRVTLQWSPYKSICHQQLSVSSSLMHGGAISKAIDLRTCTPEAASLPPRIWSQDDPNSATGTIARYIDEKQDLMVTVNSLPNNSHIFDIVYQINFRTISTDEEHPLAHGSCLVKSKAPRDEDMRSHRATVTIFGDRLCFHGMGRMANTGIQLVNEEIHPYWSLRVWNWHQGDQSDVGASRSFC